MYNDVTSITWGRAYGKLVLKTTRFDGVSKVLAVDPMPFLAKTWVTLADKQKLDLSYIKTVEDVDNLTPFRQPTVKLSVAVPHQIKQIQYSNPDVLFYQADVPYGLDVFITTGMHITKHLIPKFVDIEINPLQKVTDLVKTPINPIISISLTDIHGKTKWLCNSDEITLLNQINEEFKSFAYMLSWADLDYKYPAARAKQLGIYSLPFLKVEGIDMMRLFSRAIRKTTETDVYIRLIDATAELQIPMQDYGAKSNIGLISKWFTQERLKLKQYNVQDSEVLWHIDDKLKIVETLAEILYQLNIFVTQYNETSQIFDHLRLRAAFNRKPRIVLPNRRRKPGQYQIHFITKKPAGGFVFDPVPGRYKVDVTILDSKNHYPRIIKALNIGLDTYAEDGDIKTEKLTFTSKRLSLAKEVITWFDGLLAKFDAEYQKDKDDKVAYFKRAEIKHKINAIYGQFGFMVHQFKHKKGAECNCNYVTADRLYDPEVLESVTLTGQAIIKAAAEYVRGIN